MRGKAKRVEKDTKKRSKKSSNKLFGKLCVEDDNQEMIYV